MTTLIVAEHDNLELKPATLNAAAAAQAIGGDINILVAGSGCAGVGEQAATEDVNMDEHHEQLATTAYEQLKAVKEETKEEFISKFVSSAKASAKSRFQSRTGVIMMKKPALVKKPPTDSNRDASVGA